MPRSRTFSRKPSTKRTSAKTPTAPHGNGNTLHEDRSNGNVDQSGMPPEQLASDDSKGHDSETWQVSDDWPEFVPITLEEVEVIEAFLRDAIDDILK